MTIKEITFTISTMPEGVKITNKPCPEYNIYNVPFSDVYTIMQDITEALNKEGIAVLFETD